MYASFQALLLIQVEYKQSESQLRLLLNHIKSPAIHTASSQPRVQNIWFLLEDVFYYNYEVTVEIDANESTTFSISQKAFITK